MQKISGTGLPNMKAFDQDPWVAVTVNPFSEKAVVTSLGSEDAVPQRLYEKVYCVRGDMEKPHQRMSARSVRRPYLGGNDARQPAASVVRLDGYVLLCAGRAAIPQHSGRRFRDVSGFGGRSRLWEVVGARFVADSPLEREGFEPSVPRKIVDAFETALFASAAPSVPPERPDAFARRYVQPINYPTVPCGAERLRLIPTPLHSDADIDALAAALCAVWYRVCDNPGASFRRFADARFDGFLTWRRHCGHAAEKDCVLPPA